MRTVITGGAGFIGSHLCDALLARGHEVVCIDNLLTGSSHDIWAVNVESAYHEEQTDAEHRQPYRGDAPVTPVMQAEEERLHRHARERERV